MGQHAVAAVAPAECPAPEVAGVAQRHQVGRDAQEDEGLMRDFNWVPCPLKMPPLPIYAVWHARKDSDPAHKWLRQQIKKSVRR